MMFYMANKTPYSLIFKLSKYNTVFHPVKKKLFFYHHFLLPNSLEKKNVTEQFHFLGVCFVIKWKVCKRTIKMGNFFKQIMKIFRYASQKQKQGKRGKKKQKKNRGDDSQTIPRMIQAQEICDKSCMGHTHVPIVH